MRGAPGCPKYKPRPCVSWGYASVAVQLSGTFGSRQEEAQRLGRILRPKEGENEAHFYSIVSRNTVDQDYAHNRQLFLAERGYRYDVADAETWGDPG